MKVIIDIPNKFFEIARGILLGAAISEEMENYVHDAMVKINEMREKGEPLHIRLERMMDGEADSRQAYSQIMSAIAVMALGEFKEEEKSSTSSLTARLESLQRQAEELKRKIQEGKI